MKLTRICQECGKKFRTYKKDVDRGFGNFCSRKCAMKYRHKVNKRKKEKKARDNPLIWSNHLAYLVGLITSDGYVSKDKPQIRFCSKDKSLMKQVKDIIRKEIEIKDVKILKRNRKSGILWECSWTSRRLYYLLNDIGVMNKKSCKLEKIDIPHDKFSPWLRGEIDGDGCFWIEPGKYKKLLRLGIYSGSEPFLVWISNKLKNLNLVQGKGNVHDKGDVYGLEFGHDDSISVANFIYDDSDYYLKRKFEIVKQCDIVL